MTIDLDTAPVTRTTRSTAARPVAALPMTESQKGLLVVDRVAPARHLYNVVTELELDPAYSAADVTAALATVIAVQPALRLRFSEPPDLNAVLCPPPAAGELPIEVTEVADDYALEPAVEEAVGRLGGRPFDLTTGPLYRFGYLRSDARAVLVAVTHHTVFDGFSLRPLVRDLNAALTGAVAGETLREQRERALHRELAAQVRVAADPDTTARAARWADRLRAESVTRLHPHPNRPAETDFSGARLQWRLDVSDAEAVRAACRRLDTTPFVFFTAVYAAVLGRFAAAPAVVIGSPFVARRTTTAFDLCGFFVNTLPISVGMDWSMPFDEYAARTVRAAADYARANVNVAFNQLVQHLQPDRSTNRNPVFSCMLAMQDDLSDVRGAAVHRVRERANGTAKFDLWLGVTPTDGGWLLEVEHDRELVPDSVAAAFLESLRIAVAKAAHGSARLADLFRDASFADSYVTDGYWQEPPAASLAAAVHHTAGTQPHAIAIEDEHGVTTYQQLDRLAASCASGLRRLGVGVGDIVGLNSTSLADTVTAILAILRCGAAYLPLDPSLPAERLSYMVRKAGCQVVVGEPGPFPASTVTVQQLFAAGDDAALASCEGSAAHPNLPRNGTPPAYVMFTSGSTGQPKGVHMGQRALLNLTAWQVAALDMGAQTRFLQYAPLGFDVSFQEILPTLVAGGTVVSREPADRRDFPALAERVSAAAITHLYLPVAALRPFVQAAGHERLDNLRFVCVSGEQLTVDDRVRTFFASRPGCRLVNLYGPTETHAVTTHRLAADSAWPSHVPIGRPLTGVTAYVVDATGHLAPTGVPGELHLGGHCPADGYINDPDRTARGFLPDRFSGHGTMYRTGDQVLRDEAGILIFLGRNDEQVKIRGHRVELGEVEVAAAAYPGVRQVAAAVRDIASRRELMLFILGDADPAAMRDHLRSVLPAYMVPAWVVPVERVPVTKNGKVDRAALLADAEAVIKAAADKTAGSEPAYSSELERDVAAIWARLLGRADLEPGQSLLDYGAHSLTAFTALAQIQQRYGTAVPIGTFFRSPTITALAAAVRASGEAK
jgi:amino acid adenylation domain-containing protein